MNHDGFLLDCLAQRRGPTALMNVLHKRFHADIEHIERAGTIATALPLDVLALVLGTYGYRCAARLSRVCKRFRDAVQKRQFWTRGIRIELERYLRTNTKHGLEFIPMVVRECDPFVRYSDDDPAVSIKTACEWMFNAQLINHNVLYNKKKFAVGIANRVRFDWNDNSNTFTIRFGDFFRTYHQKSGVDYPRWVVRKNGVTVNRKNVYRRE